MNWKDNLHWYLYTLIFTLLSVGHAVSVLTPGAPANMYYTILHAFGSIFTVYFYASIICALINLIALLPLYGYITHTSFGHYNLWLIALIVRLIFDLFGHSYEWQTIKSLTHGEHWAMWITAASYIAMPIPSYTAHIYFLKRLQTNAAKTAQHS